MATMPDRDPPDLSGDVITASGMRCATQPVMLPDGSFAFQFWFDDVPSLPAGKMPVPEAGGGLPGILDLG